MSDNQIHRPDPMAFISGSGEMARRIREHDWGATPFGPLADWPQSLRSALSICLNSNLPTAIYWGPELRLLYNDAWAPVPGPRHPQALGAPAREVWSDIWHVIGPQFARILKTGEGVFVENQMLPMERYGVAEETYWSYSFSAIRGEDGEIAGIFNCGSETTETVLSQRQMRVLLDLGDRLRNQKDARSALREAVEVVGTHYRVDRAGLYLVDHATGEASVAEEWLAPGSRSLGPSVRLTDFGAASIDRSRAGGVIRLHDALAEKELPDGAARQAFLDIGVRAALRVPCIEDGRLVAMMFLHSATPRAWSDSEVATVQQVLERTWNWMERERAAQREKLLAREVDHRAKNTLAVVQAILRLMRADNIDEFREKVNSRVAALAGAHNLLASRSWTSVELGALLSEELAVIRTEERRIALEGPPVEIAATNAQAMALLVHELATNALKHGALSSPAGELAVRWQVDDGGLLRLDWSERAPGRGGAAQPEPAPGFGSLLIDAVVRGQLGGTIEVSHRDDTRLVRLTAPLAAARGAGARLPPSPVD